MWGIKKSACESRRSARLLTKLFMEKVKVFEVKVLISKSEHMNKKKIVDALGIAIEKLRSRDVTLVQVKEMR